MRPRPSKPKREAPRLDHRLCRHQIADAAGRFNAQLRPDACAHQANIFDRSAAARKTGRSLDEIRARRFGRAARRDDLVGIEKRSLENHFNEGFARRRLHDGGDVALHIIPIAIKCGANGNHHIHFVGARFDGGFGFFDLGAAQCIAVRKADDSGDFDRCSSQNFGAQWNPARRHAHREEAVSCGLIA